MRSDKIAAEEKAKDNTPTRSNASRKYAIVGVAAIAAGAGLIAIQQTQGIASKRQLSLYSNPVTGGVFKYVWWVVAPTHTIPTWASCIPLIIRRLLFAHAIKTANLASSSLPSVPRALLCDAFGNLRSLNLSGNPITVLPPEISALTSLAKLNMARCQLTELPDSISSLEHLIDLDLGKNKYGGG